MGFTAQLTRHGFVRFEDGKADLVRTDDVFALLGLWHWQLSGIAEDVSLGDLLAVLHRVEGIERLGPMFGTDIAALLDEATKPATKEPNDRIEHVEVYNRMELSRYIPDPNQPDEDPIQWLDEDEEDELDQVDETIADLTGEGKPFKIYDATGDDPITGKPRVRRLRLGERHGTWGGPYILSREFHGWGRWEEPCEGYFAEHPEIDPESFRGGYGLSLTPVQNLLHYPLHYNADFEIRDDLYGGDVLVKDTLSITTGEFIHAIIWELGFYGTPEDRGEVREMLTDPRFGDLPNREARSPRLRHAVTGGFITAGGRGPSRFRFSLRVATGPDLPFPCLAVGGAGARDLFRATVATSDPATGSSGPNSLTSCLPAASCRSARHPGSRTAPRAPGHTDNLRLRGRQGFRFPFGAAAHPLSTPRGRSRTTLRPIPAPSTTSTTSATSL